MTLNDYIRELNEQYATGVAREHTYRPALSKLLEHHLPNLHIANEPARMECGALDFALIRKRDGLPVAFVETKDLFDRDLEGCGANKEQFDRYKAALDTLLFTDYLDFLLYVGGVQKMRVSIARRGADGALHPIQEHEEEFALLMGELAHAEPAPIKNPQELAERLADKAKLLAHVIHDVLQEGGSRLAERQIQMQYEAFKKALLPNISEAAFADVYAQTIVYGLFAARLHDEMPGDFSRQRAAVLVPKTNPFLRQFFQMLAGYDLHSRIASVVDALVLLFKVTDLHGILGDYGVATRRDDPMVHFYEDFLGAYNPVLRKAKGVYYTPQPVVRFIVRAVDDILRRDFALPEGLADRSSVEVQGKPMHRVQILDPATGTGTFLAEIVALIYDRFRQAGDLGMWPSYVGAHLLPRLNGFELMMAPYAMAHLKLEMLLASTGYTPMEDQRLQVYLTNALQWSRNEELEGYLWFGQEAHAANRIKREVPVMVVLGNPPYSVGSENKGEEITHLISDYKRNLNERKLNLDDDYVKFFRLGQEYIARSGEGVLAYISNNNFLNAITFRQMRRTLLESFDAIYILDLHGNARKQEVPPEGGKDENVFDIQVGVSINILVKRANAKRKGRSLARLFHHDLWGKREDKYGFLEENTLKSVPWQELRPIAPYYFFTPKDFTFLEEFNEGFRVVELFMLNSVGIVTAKDAFVICSSPDQVQQRITRLIQMPEKQLREMYSLKDTDNWLLLKAKEDVGTRINPAYIRSISYRPFDTRFLYYTEKAGLVSRPRYDTMRHMLPNGNISLVIPRQTAQVWRHAFLSDRMTNGNYLAVGRQNGAGVQCPLYLFTEGLNGEGKIPNLSPVIWKKIDVAVGRKTTPEEVFDYIYAVLHSPTYRERYQEFLKIDFPRVPYPKGEEQFAALVALGGQLRGLHLLTGADGWATGITYPVAGDHRVDSPQWKCDSKEELVAGRVYINDAQYFEGVPKGVWEFWVGGYQPAQRWLKDRREKSLSVDEIAHYKSIIHSLRETIRLMGEVDKVF